jgi:hypothetical protein
MFGPHGLACANIVPQGVVVLVILLVSAAAALSAAIMPGKQVSRFVGKPSRRATCRAEFIRRAFREQGHLAGPRDADARIGASQGGGQRRIIETGDAGERRSARSAE